MRRPLRLPLRRFLPDRRGIAAVELALLTPIYLLFAAAIFQIGYSYALQLKVVSAVSAAAQYAFLKGQTLTSTSVPAFLTNVKAVVESQSGLGVTVTGTVLYNNAANGSAAGTYYCLSSAQPPVWTSTGSSSASCGGNVMSGKFVTITATAAAPTFILPPELTMPTVSDSVIVRVQ